MLIPNPNYNMSNDVSSDESFDSDQIDSDIEAELYSSIHHEVVITDSDNNPENELNSSISFISVEDNNKIIEKDLNSDNNNSNKGTEINKNQVINKTIGGLKRKSNLISSILDTIQVQNKSPRKKQKVKNCRNRTTGSPSSSGNVTIEISDSDSESSVIFLETDKSSAKKFQTNIQTLCLSSDSESSLTSIDESRTSFDFNLGSDYKGNYKDVWKINDADLYRIKRKSAGRYHENAVSQCSNCKRKGHIAKYCTEPKVLKCFICGGIHPPLHCQNRICVKCLRYGHDSRRCYFPVDNLVCNICRMRGHAEKCCPDLWRRFHLTTSGRRIVESKSFYTSSPMFCFNCGVQGHYGFDCKKSRMGRSYPTFLSVVSYENPYPVYENPYPVSNNPYPVSNEFIMERNFGGTIPQLLDPCQLSSRKLQKKLLKDHKKKARQLKRRKAAIKGRLNNLAKCQQQSVVNSTLHPSCNFEHKKVCRKQEIIFPRTPKVNASPSQCVDELPKMKRSRPRNKKKKEKLRKAMRVVQNCS